MERVPQNPEPQRVFLCHGKEDKEEVRKLYHQLKTDGFQPWLDEEDLLPGQEWEPVIQETVRKADAVVVCLSKSSAARRGFAQKEIRIALDVAEELPEGEIYIIPLRLEELVLPQRLCKWHWVDLFHPQGYERLVQALQSKERSTRAPADSSTASGTYIPLRAAAPGSEHSPEAPAPEGKQPAAVIQSREVLISVPKKAPIGRSTLAVLGSAVVILFVILGWGSGLLTPRLKPSKLTATYRLEVTVTLTKRSPPQWTPWGPKVRIPKLGRDGSDFNCTDRANHRDVCVPIPADSVPVFASPGVPRVEAEPADQWGSWCDGQRPDAVARVEDNQVCKPYWNWRQSKSHFKSIRLLYEVLTTSRESKPLVLTDSNGMLAETLTPGEVYSTDLTDAYVSFSEPAFELLVRRSDGLEITATDESTDPQRLFVSYNEASQRYQVRLESNS